MPRRFPPPWSIEERQESFIVKDTNGWQITYLYFEDEPQRQKSMKRLSRDEAFLIAVNIAKLVPRQILKDIPRPPNPQAGTIERDCQRRSVVRLASRRHSKSRALWPDRPRGGRLRAHASATRRPSWRSRPEINFTSALQPQRLAEESFASLSRGKIIAPTWW
jgi:hypothetical protein